MNVIIAGSRTFTDYEKLKGELNRLNLTISKILSGGATGADSLGEQYAREHNIPIMRFDADWIKFGRSAGPIRNTNMAKFGDVLVAFWDGKSRGTYDMISKMEQKSKPVFIILVKSEE